MDAIRVLHVDTGKDWRGGQQQAAYLYQAMVQQGFHTNLVCQPDSPFQAYCQQYRLPFHAIRIRGDADLVAGIRIGRWCRQKGFNILHLHSAHAMATGLWATFFYPGPRLVGVRRVDFPIRKDFFSQWKYRSRRMDRIVCISDGIKRVMLAGGIPAEKMVTIHSGVPLDKYTTSGQPGNARQEMGIPDNHILVGTIAALTGHKDYPTLLKAARIVLQQSDNISFYALGDGPDRPKLATLHQSLKLGNRFIFGGFKEDGGRFLKSFDIFVLASKLEGLGTSLLDAQAAGLPVIATRTGGIPEAVTDGHNGMLVPPGDAPALAAAILKLAGNERLRTTLGAAARQSVKNFDIQQTIQKNILLYEQLVT